ncbi:hypothetical protein CANCADRAFT_45403 [Tortispora caseinolytica NRRL Y-17796]|uniref:Altered inheritance of mitochondria protein 21 n=1 Tax=Tortispora caseinolytica NRRL Y-17796 TaxID=767744 RepID=A0A1E4TAZ1_9ASCO|nr:hypothetical protein CANCADRAFT_45403 [Tortispora caseinolytica NRRL Y-17796]
MAETPKVPPRPSRTTSKISSTDSKTMQQELQTNDSTSIHSPALSDAASARLPNPALDKLADQPLASSEVSLCDTSDYQNSDANSVLSRPLSSATDNSEAITQEAIQRYENEEPPAALDMPVVESSIQAPIDSAEPIEPIEEPFDEESQDYLPSHAMPAVITDDSDRFFDPDPGSFLEDEPPLSAETPVFEEATSMPIMAHPAKELEASFITKLSIDNQASSIDGSIRQVITEAEQAETQEETETIAIDPNVSGTEVGRAEDTSIVTTIGSQDEPLEELPAHISTESKEGAKEKLGDEIQNTADVSKEITEEAVIGTESLEAVSSAREDPRKTELGIKQAEKVEEKSSEEIQKPAVPPRPTRKPKFSGARASFIADLEARMAQSGSKSLPIVPGRPANKPVLKPRPSAEAEPLPSSGRRVRGPNRRLPSETEKAAKTISRGSQFSVKQALMMWEVQPKRPQVKDEGVQASPEMEKETEAAPTEESALREPGENMAASETTEDNGRGDMEDEDVNIELDEILEATIAVAGISTEE